jgi:glycosyltransferase involved in cell wall biosynthesis
MSPISEISDQLRACGSAERDHRSDASVGLSTIKDLSGRSSTNAEQLSTINNQPSTALRVSLLTGGGDKPYALGMAAALTSVGIHVDFIGSDDLSVPELLNDPLVDFLNLRGEQRPQASRTTKALRVLSYYVRLIRYAATARPKLFHILWNNKFELFDRTLLMLYYRLLRKKVVLTVHNVNAGKRDANDSYLNRLSLRIQYNLCHHIFVHTDRMKSELTADFEIASDKVSVIPFGINNTVSNTTLSRAEAKAQLGISKGDKVLLFFGNIAPYKGLEYLTAAFTELWKKGRSYRLIIAGAPKGGDDYWKQIRQSLACNGARDGVIERIGYIPDEDTELYFKAADVLILPYAHVFQSGVLFLGYSFGLPAIAADVGNLKEEIVEGETGFVFRPQDSSDLANKIEKYFKSELFQNLERNRREIKRYANERYSWGKVAKLTANIYLTLLGAK